MCVQGRAGGAAADASAARTTPSTTLATSPFVKTRRDPLPRGAALPVHGAQHLQREQPRHCWYAMSSGPTLDDSLDAIGPGKEVFEPGSSSRWPRPTASGLERVRPHALGRSRPRRKVIADPDQPVGRLRTGGYKDGLVRDGYRARPGRNVSYRDWVAGGRHPLQGRPHDPRVAARQRGRGQAASRRAWLQPGCGGRPSERSRPTCPACQVDRPEPPGQPRHDRHGQCGAQDAEYQDVHSVPTIDLCEYHDYRAADPMPGTSGTVSPSASTSATRSTSRSSSARRGSAERSRRDVPSPRRRPRPSSMPSSGRGAGDLAWAWSALGSTSTTTTSGLATRCWTLWRSTEGPLRFASRLPVRVVPDEALPLQALPLSLRGRRRAPDAALPQLPPPPRRDLDAGAAACRAPAASPTPPRRTPRGRLRRCRSAPAHLARGRTRAALARPGERRDLSRRLDREHGRALRRAGRRPGRGRGTAWRCSP